MPVKSTFSLFIILAVSFPLFANQQQESLNDVITQIKQYHAYQSLNHIDWKCIETNYQSSGNNTPSQELLMLENLMLEFADNHMHLNTNNKNSYRLFGPVVARKSNDGYFINDLWKNNIVNHTGVVIGAQILSINNQSPAQIIANFPTTCLDKTNQLNQQWIINKSIAGTYSTPRELTISNETKTVTINLDDIKYKSHLKPLSFHTEQAVGIITIHDALGQTDLIAQFDHIMDNARHTNGLIIDLRNTISGGDSYIARAIISRLIDQPQAYQKHQFDEQRNGAVKITRSWVEFVEPRLATYRKPIVVLINHWTGSMGEGLAIGLQGMNRATLMGTPMAGLLGAVNGFSIKHLSYGFQMPVERLYHIDGTPRELIRPDYIVKPGNDKEDNLLSTAIDYLNQQ